MEGAGRKQGSSRVGISWNTRESDMFCLEMIQNAVVGVGLGRQGGHSSPGAHLTSGTEVLLGFPLWGAFTHTFTSFLFILFAWA